MAQVTTETDARRRSTLALQRIVITVLASMSTVKRSVSVWSVTLDSSVMLRSMSAWEIRVNMAALATTALDDSTAVVRRELAVFN